MIDQIIAAAQSADFDFRSYANPRDPLRRHFEEWVPYYRLKYAIARALQPASILEIGVRFGYSAAAFLAGAPGARLVGIDLNVATYGGQVDALEWARRITAGSEAEFVVADSQEMSRFPGGIYDLIHVDGQQDGAGTFHDLRRAVAQGRWVLLDGYFWTRENFADASDFLLKYKDVLEYALVIPGYAGELLLRVKEEYLASCAQVAPGETASTQLTSFYDSHYFLNDCGGYREFRQSGGQRVDDPRLLAVLMLTRVGQGGPMLDLGCGRGEVTFQLAANGEEVTAVDYSAAAIELAQRNFRDAPGETRRNAKFVCGDVAALELGEKFGTALAADLIEHLAPEELGRFYEAVARLLKPDGVFIIHTAPNVWRYRRDYPRQRKAVARLGGYLPAEPRSRYELLMHINEQSPARLRRDLGKFFAHVAVWVSHPSNPAGSLVRDFSLGEMTAAPDVYALASAEPLDLSSARAWLESRPLPRGEHGKFTIRVPRWPEQAVAGTTFDLPVELSSSSHDHISSLHPAGVYVSYHWSRAGEDRPTVFDGLRTALPFGLGNGETRTIIAAVEPPASAGEFLLVLTLVQEGVCWFERMPGFTPAEAVVKIQERAS